MESKALLNIPCYIALALESCTDFTYSKNKFNEKKKMYRCTYRMEVMKTSLVRC